ncbi:MULTISPECIES: hypothetical protein [Streptomyces]|uniref:Uncharacterized protein n=2 Tax=Streptomyces nigrescens TaxID=1920 RepID=A0A640TZ61_STRNI|nr:MULTISPECIES: hypothetical protein [Streptomyces]MCX5444389.1 hypothetical protein [Streptomyces libani]WAU01439.1 hypothetical protein STRLI_007785 [Streptomyces libani subsp. libani]WAU09302.1 hypothetical protein STRNI_008093 [Streptomyces nigrescens]GFE27375.1 hypothetical protein Sliba_78280 [Streptomyces libani subsp. libani]GGV96320.1 hypothetical protein GCM10010500_38790 [Streptomyces libani subsp. libani]
MDINWGTLGGVFGVSLGITVVVVVMFSLGLAAWARAGHGEPAPGTPPGRHQKVAAVTAVLCFAACLAVAAYGIDLIVPG